MGLSREELVTLGQSFSTELLTEWASAQASLAKRSTDRLQKRGVTPAFLQTIERLVSSVRSSEGAQERGKKGSQDATDRVERVKDEALGWWREVKLATKVEYGTEPDVLAQFRTGVKVGGSVPRLAREIDFVLPLLRERQEQLAWLGVNDEFLRRGEGLLGQLHEVDDVQETQRKAMPPATAELNLAKGQLFDIVRKLVRIARLEYVREPEQSAAYGYDILRRNQVAKRGARTRASKTA